MEETTIMKPFDFISDLHLDFWLQHKGPTKQDNQRETDLFVDSLLPDEISKVLVIAGDMGHRNEQNYKVLRSFKRYYDTILVVAGNHDYYLVNSKQRYKHQTSMNRWSHMKSLALDLAGVHYLEGDIATVDGIRFGGTGMWYDFSFGIQVLGKSMIDMQRTWASQMNDYTHMIGLPRRTFDMFREEKKKLDRVISDCDVIITHVSPDWTSVPVEYQMDALSGCYYFDGSQYFESIQGKIWCSGHTHHKHSYIKNGCWFINNALGYPKEDKRPKGKIENIYW